MKTIRNYSGEILYKTRENIDTKKMLERAIAKGTDLDSAVLEYADLSGAKLNGIRSKEINLVWSVLIGADVRNSTLWAPVFVGANLRGSDFSYSDLPYANFSGADLRGANFSGTNLHGAKFAGANLNGANFSSANLSHTDFQYAKIRKADLHDANIIFAGLEYADLNGSNFLGATISFGDEEEAAQYELERVNSTHVLANNGWRIEIRHMDAPFHNDLKRWYLVVVAGRADSDKTLEEKTAMGRRPKMAQPAGNSKRRQ